MFLIAGIISVMMLSTLLLNGGSSDEEAIESNALDQDDCSAETDHNAAFFDTANVSDESPDFGQAGATLAGQTSDDLLAGTLRDDEIGGRDGDDTMHGNAGSDFVYGHAGHDVAFGGSGDDKLTGASGEDVLMGEAGGDTIFGGLKDDLLFGGQGDDALTGGTGADLLLGSDGADSLNGSHGNDTLVGGNGQDVLFGGQGNDFVGGRSTDRQPDFLNGGKGDDTLMAYNNDIMNGGEGEDVFVTEPKNESVPVIQDFIAGEDLIVVIAEDLPENSAVAVETDENGTSSIFANDMLVAFAHGPIPPTQEDVVIDLAAKFPPALCDVLGVRSLALEGNFSHRVSSEEFQRRHV